MVQLWFVSRLSSWDELLHDPWNHELLSVNGQFKGWNLNDLQTNTFRPSNIGVKPPNMEAIWVSGNFFQV